MSSTQKPKKLWKSTIIIWSEEDDNPQYRELDNLGREAVEGASYCSRMEAVLVDNPQDDPDWDGTDFFGDNLEEE